MTPKYFISIISVLSATQLIAVTGTSPEFQLSIGHSGVRESSGEESIAFSSQWEGGSGNTVEIAQDAVVLYEGLTGTGSKTWQVARNGTYVLTHTTYQGSSAVKVETATFIVTGFPPTETETTPVPVPYAWLEPYVDNFGGGDYEAAGLATGNNGYTLWESYVAGLLPTQSTSQLITKIAIGESGDPEVTWEPDLRDDVQPRDYTVLGKATLLDNEWVPVTDDNKSQMHFFKVTVEMR